MAAVNAKIESYFTKLSAPRQERITKLRGSLHLFLSLFYLRQQVKPSRPAVLNYIRLYFFSNYFLIFSCSQCYKQDAGVALLRAYAGFIAISTKILLMFSN